MATGKQFEADARKHFDQACQNLNRATAAEKERDAALGSAANWRTQWSMLTGEYTELESKKIDADLRATTAEHRVKELEGILGNIPRTGYATVVKDTITGDIHAVFAYSDLAAAWADRHYRNRHTLVPIAGKKGV